MHGVADAGLSLLRATSVSTQLPPNSMRIKNAQTMPRAVGTLLIAAVLFVICSRFDGYVPLHEFAGNAEPSRGHIASIGITCYSELICQLCGVSWYVLWFDCLDDWVGRLSLLLDG